MLSGGCLGGAVLRLTSSPVSTYQAYTTALVCRRRLQHAGCAFGQPAKPKMSAPGDVAMNLAGGGGEKGASVNFKQHLSLFAIGVQRLP